ncbi:MAG: isoleucine--tRNA ligase [Gemmatimonadota bacterium]
MSFPEYPDSPTRLEEEVLLRWREEDLFRRTLEATEGGEEFVFYEGPPTANGRPGIHHVISRTLKDLFVRFRTMQGRHVTRIAGWDTHGLPVEIAAEKQLGISGKQEIEELGVARFNKACRDSVFTYKEDWERLSERIGYWLDYSRPYVTFSDEYVESVWAILKRLAERDFLYRGYKSVPYCPRCGTALSSHEVAQGYEDVFDPSLYFLCELADDPSRAFLVWTTTPWTVPSNVALAVHPELAYAEVEHEGRRLILAEARVEAVFGAEARVVARHAGAQLAGVRYRRPFDLVPAPDGAEDTAWQIYLEPFVTAEDGTGIVHLAPAFGADDYAAGERHGLPMLRPVGDDGRFGEAVDLVGGMPVKEADPVLVEALAESGLLFRHTLEEHSYPHCWRCSSPLIYMARDSWFLRTTAVRDEMVAANRGIHWHPPEVGSGRMGEWLEGNVDWAISRERYWGTPLPVWVCSEEPEHIEVMGSYAELAERAGPLGEDFDPHKPYIDEPAWPCSRCAGTMRRTPEVVDVWFDSGSMPYAQWHWPFENQDAFERHFPADYICEGVDQTRGWFYSLLAISTMLGNQAPYRHVVVNDLILDAEGRKMSKSRGNVVDPWDAIAVHGADALRWHFVTVSQPWVPKRYDPEALAEAARRTFDTLANTYRFLALYANLEGWAPSDDDPPVEARPVLDRWVLSRVAGLAERVGAEMEAYEATRAARAVSDFVVDDLSNWYVRRSRARFWGSADAADTRAAFRTLHEALVTVARLLAPFVPFTADWLHRAVVGESVHLASFPEAVAPRDVELEEGMEATRMLASLGRAAREAIGIRVRQPLRALHAVIPGRAELTDELLAVLRDELNVKEVHFLAGAEELVSFQGVPNFRVLGKRFGPDTPRVAEAIRALPSDALLAVRSGGELAVEVDGERHVLSAEEVEVREEARGELAVQSEAGYVAALDPALDDALRREGLARELVSRIQRLRRDAGLEVSDRVRLAVAGSEPVLEAAATYADYIMHETLAVEVGTGADAVAGLDHAVELELDGMSGRVGLTRAD